MANNFLASINGSAIRINDLLYSTWHGRAFFATRTWVDDTDGEVYFILPDGGNVSLKSVAVYKKDSPAYGAAVDDALAWELSLRK